MRSDFYPLAQQSDVFLRMKGESGQFDLLAPGPEVLRRIITEPARMAGVKFEERAPEFGGRSLVGRILEDASETADILPLLSDVLLTLYGLRTEENTITFAAYESLGDESRTGLEGALSKRAEDEFNKLPLEQRAVFPEILHALVTVEAEADANRKANLEDLRDTPQKAALVDALIEARLLTADGEQVSLAHCIRITFIGIATQVGSCRGLGAGEPSTPAYPVQGRAFRAELGKPGPRCFAAALSEGIKPGRGRRIAAQGATPDRRKRVPANPELHPSLAAALRCRGGSGAAFAAHGDGEPERPDPAGHGRAERWLSSSSRKPLETSKCATTRTPLPGWSVPGPSPTMATVSEPC